MSFTRELVKQITVCPCSELIYTSKGEGSIFCMDMNKLQNIPNKKSKAQNVVYNILPSVQKGGK